MRFIHYSSFMHGAPKWTSGSSRYDIFKSCASDGFGHEQIKSYDVIKNELTINIDYKISETFTNYIIELSDGTTVKTSLIQISGDTVRVLNFLISDINPPKSIKAAGMGIYNNDDIIFDADNKIKISKNGSVDYIYDNKVVLNQPPSSATYGEWDLLICQNGFINRFPRQRESGNDTTNIDFMIRSLGNGKMYYIRDWGLKTKKIRIMDEVVLPDNSEKDTDLMAFDIHTNTKGDKSDYISLIPLTTKYGDTLNSTYKSFNSVNMDNYIDNLILKYDDQRFILLQGNTQGVDASAIIAEI